MDVDPSLSKLLQPSHAPAYQNAKAAASGRSGPHKRQRVNLTTQGANTSDKAYAGAASSAAEKVDDDVICEYDSDAINFLGENPCYHSSDEE